MMTRMMFDDDTKKPDFSTASSAAWEKCLCRKVAGFMVSILQRIYQLEDHGGDQEPSVVSKKAFYQQLSVTMSTYRGPRDDRSKRIVWITYPTRRFGNQFKQYNWCAEAAILDINNASIPQWVSPNQEKRTRPVDCPELILSRCTCGFEAEMTHGNLSALRLLAIRAIMFEKERLVETGKISESETVLPAQTRYWLDDYEILEGVKIRSFFWSDSSWATFLKHTYYRTGKYANPNMAVDKVKNYRSIWMKARTNVESWDRSNWVQSSILWHSSSDSVAQEDLQKLEAMIKNGHPTKEINTMAISNGIFTKNYVKYLWENYLSYKENAIQELNKPGMDGVNARKKYRMS